jgi:hypothetical protein
LCLVSLAATAAYAVDQLPEKEEDIPVEFIPKLDTIVSVGLHHLQHGPKVRFGNLGNIPLGSIASADTTDTITSTYSNGKVSKDGYSASELDANGAALLVGTTYQTSSYISRVDAYTAPDHNGTMVSGNTVTIFQRVGTVETVNGTYVVNSDGTYVPVTTPSQFTNPDGTTTTVQTQVPTWASASKILGYKDGQTRSWYVNDANQIDMANRTVSMSSYGAGTSGASREADSSGSSGFDVSIERQIGHRGRLEWGVSAGLKLVDINAKAADTIQANLLQTKDVYRLVDTGLNTALYASLLSAGNTISVIQPTGDAGYLPVLDLAGQQVVQYGGPTVTPTTTTGGVDQSLGTPLDTNPADITHYGLPGTPGQIQGVVNIHGYWQLKGAYYQAQFGPTFRYRFNDRWAVSGSAGFALGWIGTTFSADEHFDNTVDVTLTSSDSAANQRIYDEFAANPKTYQSAEKNTTHKFLPGYYVEFNAEYWVTERTGFYFGVSQQAMRGFNQNPLSGRTAKVDMGSSAGWRIGIVTRF